MTQYILAIDQGTTSTRAIAFDRGFEPRAVAQIELTQHFPQPGWVEHDADEIWAATLQVCREVIDKVGGPQAIACIGVTNQRETTVVWERAGGKPIHKAIVWQDRRTSDACAQLKAAGHEPMVQEKTGLLLDPYFSGTKIAAILDATRLRDDAASLAFGTIDSFLVWRLTGGRVHATDATNASRTLLFALEPPAWSDDLAQLLRAPRALLPEVKPSAGRFGETDPALFGRAIPITGVAGDQQAALVGHGCLEPGMAKATYGTGCFLVMNAGATPPVSKNRLLATVGYQIDGATIYALEGSIFSAGATIQWLKEGLHLINASRDSEAMAAQIKDNGGVYLVPAFAGLGAPQWNADARGAIVGLTRDSNAAHVVRAGVEAIAYQTRDLLDALAADGAPRPKTLRVDGGVTANGWAMQFLADICDAPVERPAFQEVTALGAAKLAALGAGLIPSLDSAAPAAPAARWTPAMAGETRASLLAGWRAAVAGVLAQAGGQAGEQADGRAG
jgi:glycerol kinase